MWQEMKSRTTALYLAMFTLINHSRKSFVMEMCNNMATREKFAGILRVVHDEKELVLIPIIGFIAKAKLIHTYSFFCHVVINPGCFIDTIFYLMLSHLMDTYVIC